LTFAPG